MFITKSDPNVANDGKIKANITIKKGVLLIDDKVNHITLKYENGKWFTYGEDGKWYFLGYGANPCYQTDKDGVLDENLFNDVFEEVAQ